MSDEKKPLVSVIIPTYNRKHILTKAIQSVINQTYQSLELLVIDDGSTDGTEKAVKEFSDSRIRYFRYECNMGVAAARNVGVREATGEYIAFLDSDDEWLEEKTAAQITALMNTGEKTIAGCTGFYRIQGDYTKIVQPTSNVSWFKRLLLKCGLGPGSTLMTSRSAFEKVGCFDENLQRLEDWDWLVRYTENYPFACVRTPLARVYGGKLPNAFLVESSIQYFIKKHKKKFNSFGRCYGRKIMSLRFQELGHYWYRERNFPKGSFYFLRALLLNPFQKPMFYLTLLDSIFGTHVAPKALAWRQKIRNML